MKQIEIYMPGEPPTTTHHSKKITTRGKFARLIDSPNLKDAISIWEARLMPHRPQRPMQGACKLSIKLVFSPPAYELSTKSKRARFQDGGTIYKTTKPDLSNIAKTLEDRLVALGFIMDDQSVSILRVEKRCGEDPGTHVTITSLEDGE